MKRNFKYIEVKDGNILLLETDNFNNVIKETLDHYDSSDYIFDENLDIRAFVKMGSEFLDLKDTIYYYLDNKLVDVFKGTVLFAKNGISKWRSLSNKDIALIYKKILPTHDGAFEIFEYSYDDESELLDE